LVDVMKRCAYFAIAAGLLIDASVASQALAGPIDAGVAAYHRGDFAEAMRRLHPAAEIHPR